MNVPDAPNIPIDPCPFCGSPARWFRRKIHEDENGRHLWWVECSLTGCGVSFTHGEWDPAAAAKKWNTRQCSSSPSAVLDDGADTRYGGDDC